MIVTGLKRVILTGCLLIITLAVISQAEDENDASKAALERVQSDLDEGSCICGLNTAILDRLESIISASQKDNSQCSFVQGPIGSTSIGKPTENNQNIGIQWSGSGSGSQVFGKPSPGTSGQQPAGQPMISDQQESDQSQQTSHGSDASRPSSDHAEQQIQTQISWPSTSSSFSSDQRPANPAPWSIFGGSLPNENQQRPTGGYGTTWQINGQGLEPKPVWGYGQQSSIGSQPSRPNDQIQITKPVDSGFLQGLIGSNGVSELDILNQSQQLDTSDMQSALESTIPNLVSNIFSNIQNVTIQTGDGVGSSTGQTSAGNNANVLTSIDGSSVQLHGNRTEQITAQGEELFMQWIEHQLQTLHLTASTANYIRKSALNLFRRIVRQYVDRIERLGGRVEENVKKATQIALNNTQNLIAYILKNYINFAGGLMRIIGEQVSFVGKRIDSTGTTIANANWNPFDIVSDVIDSLPNPSHYSEYFRAFGKYLMGESTSTPSPQSAIIDNQAAGLPGSPGERPKGLFSKAMGSLSKTLGSWIG